jgi:GMP synthase (glutamine-hydrolysing)
MSRLALVLRHLDIAHLGNLEPVLLSRGYEVEYVDVAEVDVSAVDPASADLVVVLGGDMGVYESEEFPYLRREVDLLAARLGSARPTLGICLGAQLMAEALGGSVTKGPTVEIGFREVVVTDAGRVSPVRHVAGVPMMEWHGDTFELPVGALRLAGSDAYKNEAWSIGDTVFAVQFHPELTGSMYEEWIASGLEELDELGVSADDLRAEALQHGAAMEAASIAMFGEWLDGLPAAQAG